MTDYLNEDTATTEAALAHKTKPVDGIESYSRNGYLRQSPAVASALMADVEAGAMPVFSAAACISPEVLALGVDEFVCRFEDVLSDPRAATAFLRDVRNAAQFRAAVKDDLFAKRAAAEAA